MDTGTPPELGGCHLQGKELAIPVGLGCPRAELGINLGSDARLVLSGLTPVVLGQIWFVPDNPVGIFGKRRQIQGV